MFLTRRGRAVAAIVEAEQLERLRADSDELADIRAVDAAWVDAEELRETPIPWAEDTGAPGEIDRERLRHAFYAAVLLRERNDATTVQSWFKGRNPALNDEAPAHVLREGDPLKDARDVIAGAKAFAYIG